MSAAPDRTFFPPAPRTRALLICLLGILVGTHACAGGGSEAGSEGFVTSDSAGVQAAHNARALTLDAPPLTLVEDLRIGAVDGPEEYQFYSIRAVVEAPSGELLVLDRGNNVVRTFGPGGSHVASFGREGDGPGEFRRPSFMDAAGDTLLVVDQELSLFHQGEHLLTVPMRDPTLATYLSWIGRGGDRWVAATRKRGYPLGESAGPGPFIDSLVVGPVDLETGAITETILTLAVAENYLLGSAGWIVEPLFARDLGWAVAADGRIYFTPGDDYVVSVLSPEGTLSRRISADVERIPVTDTDLDEWFERRRERLAGVTVGEGGQFLTDMEAEYPALPRPEFRPIPGRIMPSPGGRMLVERVDLGPEPDEPWDAGVIWDLFDEDGRITGRLHLPESITPLRLTDDHLYTVTRDDLDVQYLVRYRIESGGM